MSHSAGLEPQHRTGPVPFTTLEAFLGRLRTYQASLMQGPSSRPSPFTIGYRKQPLAPMEDNNVRRVGQRLIRVIDGLQHKFPDESTWGDADVPDLDDPVFLKGGPVRSFQIAIVAELRKLGKAVESVKQDRYETAYHDAVCVQGPFRP